MVKWDYLPTIQVVCLCIASYCTLDAVPATHDTAFLVEAILLQMEAVQREVDLTGVSEVHSKVRVDTGCVSTSVTIGHWLQWYTC